MKTEQTQEKSTEATDGKVMLTEGPFTDEKGVEIRPFALIRRFLKYGKRNKAIYEYRWVKEIEEHGEVFLGAVELSDGSGSYYPLRSLHRDRKRVLGLEVVQEPFR